MIMRNVACRVDQRQMAQSLRKVAEHSFISWIVGFGQKADIIAETQEPLKQQARIFLASNQGEAVGQPETTREKSGLTRWERIDIWFCAIAQYKAVGHQIALNGDGAPYARVAGRQKADQRDHQ